MRIIVISDTHRDLGSLLGIVEKHKEEAAMFIHLGDGERECDDVLSLYPDLPLICIRGNCDMASMAPTTKIITARNINIFCCHGHTQSVKYGTDTLLRAARENGCTIALYGHTHVGVTNYIDGIHLMNPGSPSCPRQGPRSYGVIDIVDNGIMTFLVEV